MKRIVCLIVVVLTLWSLACPVYAARNNFVPSIGEKPGPEIGDAVINPGKPDGDKPGEKPGDKPGEEPGGEPGHDHHKVGNCLVVTSVPQAEKKTTDIEQEARDTLIDIYDQLKTGEMELPLDNDYVIRELVDISFQLTPCVGENHFHREELEKEDTSVTVIFRLGLKPDAEVVVLSWQDGEWIEVECEINREDGSVICTFENEGPVIFCVDPESAVEPPKTGDTMGAGLLLWIAVLIVSVVSALVLLRYRKRILS